MKKNTKKECDGCSCNYPLVDGVHFVPYSQYYPTGKMRCAKENNIDPKGLNWYRKT